MKRHHILIALALLTTTATATAQISVGVVNVQKIKSTDDLLGPIRIAEDVGSTKGLVIPAASTANFSGTLDLRSSGTMVLRTGSTITFESGANVSGLSGAAITLGTIAPARLGTGSSITTKYLRGDGTWQTVSGSGSPGGTDTQVQFNDSSAFGGDAGLTFNKTTDTLTTSILQLSGSTNQLKIWDGANAEYRSLNVNDYTWTFPTGDEVAATTFSGTFNGNGASISALNATQLTTGTIPSARFPATLPAANASALTALNATQLTSGTIPDARFPATLPAANASALTALNATQLTTGTVPTARLGSGTANNTTFLRGDGTWNTPATGAISTPGVAYIETNGNNSTAAIGDPSKPFTTAQAAFDAGARNFRLGVGVQTTITYVYEDGNLSLELYIAGYGTLNSQIHLNLQALDGDISVTLASDRSVYINSLTLTRSGSNGTLNCDSCVIGSVSSSNSSLGPDALDGTVYFSTVETDTPNGDILNMARLSILEGSSRFQPPQ